MARMHSKSKGKSGSTRPPVLKPPEWFDRTPEWVTDKIIELGKAGQPPSMIGLILRDQYGVPLVKAIVGKSITQVLAENGLAPSMPEPLTNLIRKAVTIRKHLEENPKDLHSKRGLQETESKIHRLSKYYKRRKILPPDWRYEPERAATLIR
ncbi:MAG: 30S ribosomal protein S15 [Candidatus Freyarchaeota archaeon]|nr:30S ribosomal protein S15 [Candidatus Jordarchaeia archaeon]MBS7268481.1 30S ribosomal protein S15 [Candidatus Jordarchaeia archaeon]MBS7278525.1 30S ribosomal protein S15 [Candidatus Jordarchaeia archaeon]